MTSIPNSNLTTRPLDPDHVAQLRAAVDNSGAYLCQMDQQVHVYPLSPAPKISFDIRMFESLYHITVTWPHDHNSNDVSTMLAISADQVVAMLDWDRECFRGVNTDKTVAHMIDLVWKHCFLPNVQTVPKKDSLIVFVKSAIINVDIVVVNGHYVVIWNNPNGGQMFQVIGTSSGELRVEQQACCAIAQIEVITHDRLVLAEMRSAIAEMRRSKIQLDAATAEMRMSKIQLDAATAEMRMAKA